MTIEPLSCPFCGKDENITITDVGTFIEISCCASITSQKCDVLSLEERETWDALTSKYSDEAESKARYAIVEDWNIRTVYE